MKFKPSLSIFLSFLSFLFSVSLAYGAQTPATSPDEAARLLDKILDSAIQQEGDLAKRMKTFTPLIETYMQTLGNHPELGVAPKSDKYFLGKLDLTEGTNQKSLLAIPGKPFLPGIGWITGLFRQLFSITYTPEGFAESIMLGEGFQRAQYNFTYVRREFLGEVRTLVFDVQPQSSQSDGAFVGRIWIEDRDYNIVRFNGARKSLSKSRLYFHFDSWRENMGPGLWLPAYVYTEESDIPYSVGRKLRFKGQTRLWGYNIERPSLQNELTSLVVESDNVRDPAADAEIVTPVEAFRSWERQAEDNVIQRLEAAGLLAPDGPVNKVLETVINNLQVTNNLDIQPPIRARVLLTTPVESFAVGHTIVLSRGFIDVLPDEASLALALAHELAHISLGHVIDTKYAFSDRSLFPDEDAFFMFSLQRTSSEEAAADKAGIEYLRNSPYKENVSNAALFLSALQNRANELPGLLRPHLGNQVTKGGKVQRMADLLPEAPELQLGSTGQIAALPLGGRIHVDLWSNKIELIKPKSVPLQSAREKLTFEVTPVFLYLTRQTSPQGTARQ